MTSQSLRERQESVPHKGKSFVEATIGASKRTSHFRDNIEDY